MKNTLRNYLSDWIPFQKQLLNIGKYKMLSVCFDKFHFFNEKKKKPKKNNLF